MMRATSPILYAVALLLFVGGACRERKAESRERIFPVRGVVQQIKPDRRTVIIRHETITNYMDAMTMPFRVRDPNLVAGLNSGDEITFALHVTEGESWMDGIAHTGRSLLAEAAPVASTRTAAPFSLGSIPEFALTNEFGQPFNLRLLQGT